ncbi:xylulokinase [Agrococcus sp. ARC_14]|uniref:xylulokinase n=1 Tax=Agrococcus sp. ARC_14 TaxID=2919927 RepID=UPI001F06763D|nr:xylulokinase [Agrococcus sp. ARC_14]MCH1883935.1 xylulokinase [Agrococcus sp. ARC_14]
MPIVAGVDVSTQSSTVELRDADTGALLGSGRAAHPRTFPPISEQDPLTWWAAVKEALAAGIAQAGVASADIRALSVGAQCHGLVMLDDVGRPLRPAKLWNDTTSAPQAERMVAELGAEGWVHAVGSVPPSAFTITKLAWIAEHEPHRLDAVRRILLPHDYITWRMTGRAATDRSDASGTGYYAAHEGRWRIDLLERFVREDLDWAPLLPTVVGPDEPAGEVLPAVAEELGLLPGVVVAAGGGDQHVGAVGLGMRTGDVTFSIGTSGVVLASSEQPVLDPTGIIDGVANATGGYLPLACTLNATKVTDWAAAMLGVDVGELGAMALAADQPDRPVFATFLDGERTPNRPDAVGVIAGLTTKTSREDVARAAFEGVLLGMCGGLERLRDVGAETDGALIATGGGARSTAYLQLLADLLGREVAVRDAPEATARGAALQAIAVLGGTSVQTVSDALRPATTSSVTPRRRVEGGLQERYRATAGWTGADRGREA